MAAGAARKTKVTIIDTEDQLRIAAAELVARERRFAIVIETHGLPPLRRAAGDLKGLLRIVTDQVISRKSGEAIWLRLETHLDPFQAETIAQVTPAALMALGLSGAKARTFIAVATTVSQGTFDFAKLRDLPDEKARAALTSLKGIGPWTAELYLLSALGRRDAWPAGDLALQVAAQSLFGLTGRPDARAMDRLATSWQPWRAVAARLLWSHYRGLRGLSQAVS